MYKTLFYLHVIGAYLIAFYSLFIYWSEHKMSLLKTGSDEYFSLNNQALSLNRTISLIAAVTFLIGGYIGTPFFKAGVLWIFLKLLVFIALMAVMGIMGARGFKKRKAAGPADNGTAEVAQADKTMGVLKHVQLVLVVLLFLLAYLKPMG